MVVILGAGASVATGIPALTQLMGLISKTNFGDVFLQRLSEYCRAKRWQPTEPDNFEKLLHDLAARGEDQGARELYSLLRNAIGEFIGSRHALSVSGPYQSRAAHAHYVDFFEDCWAQGARDFVTFNYDLHLELSIEPAWSRNFDGTDGRKNYFKDSRKVTSIDYSYNIEGNTVDVGKGVLQHVNSDGGSGVRILKLHGSLNWLKGADGARWILPTESLFVNYGPNLGNTGSTANPLTIGRHLLSRQGMEGVVPDIVPPEADKTSKPAGLETVWEAAEAAIGDAGRILIAGYSFPDTDASVTAWFAELIRGDYRKHIHILDLHPEPVRERLLAALGKSWKDNVHVIEGRFETGQLWRQAWAEDDGPAVTIPKPVTIARRRIRM